MSLLEDLFMGPQSTIIMYLHLDLFGFSLLFLGFSQRERGYDTSESYLNTLNPRASLTPTIRRPSFFTEEGMFSLFCIDFSERQY